MELFATPDIDADIRFLVVDDDAIARRIIADMLEKCRCYSRIVEDATAALQLLAIDKFDVALVDLQMPGMNGLSLLEAMKTSYSETAVIMMAMRTDDANAIQRMQQGASNFIMKPFSRADLARVVRRVTGRIPAEQDRKKKSTVASDAPIALDAQPNRHGGGLFPAGAEQIIRSVAHDLMSSLGIVTTLADWIVACGPTDKTEIDQDAHQIRKSAEYCRLLVENLRRLYLPQDLTTTELRGVDIVEAARDVLELLDPKMSESITKTLELPERAVALADPTGVRQILFNVIKNAVESMHEHGQLRVAISSDALHVNVIVSDTGDGIHSEDFEKIFQLNFTTKRGSGGSGIGLYLSNMLAKQMGAVLTFESEIGKGSRFTLQLRCLIMESDLGEF